MILSKTRPKIKQFRALERARTWAHSGNMTEIRRAIKEAAAAYPISEMQWFNLRVRIGAEEVESLKQFVAQQKGAVKKWTLKNS